MKTVNESAEIIAEYRIKIIFEKFRAVSRNVTSLLLSRNLMNEEKQNSFLRAFPCQFSFH
jgi:hypothetical protein